jgi:hypothetical protein
VRRRSHRGRIYSHFVLPNLYFDVTDQSLMGFEYAPWRTLYQGLAPGESDVFAFVARYGF